MSAVFRTRCGKCGKVQAHQGKPLETVRMNVCPDCRVRTTVIGHEPDDEAAKRMPANYERGGLAEGDNEKARRLLDVAFGAKE